jgi:hypothetical protein
MNRRTLTMTNLLNLTHTTASRRPAPSSPCRCVSGASHDAWFPTEQPGKTFFRRLGTAFRRQRGGDHRFL